jgi:hypothetical protein
MARRGLLILALIALGAALTWSAAADKPQAPADAKPANKAEPSVTERLARRIDFTGINDPDTKLGDALDKLAKDSGLAFDVNDKAFTDEQVEDVLSKSLGAEMPKMKNVTVERVLYKLLARVPVQSGATFLVRRESVEITTGRALVAEVWPRVPNAFESDASSREPQLPLVNADFDRKPLGEALKELARQSGMNVVVDVRVSEKAKLPVTARLVNTPLDTAVRTLTDMAELKPFVLDNLLYVTARDNADRLEERERGPKPGMPDEIDKRGPWRTGTGPAQGRPPRPAPDLAM